MMTIMITVNPNLQKLQHLGSVNDQKGKKGINNRGKNTFFCSVINSSVLTSNQKN
jgi:hypothetical protein